jgi:iron complex outermembrane receptor protein
MKTSALLVRLVLPAAFAASALGQAVSPAKPAPSSTDEVIEMSPFVISAPADAERHRIGESTSGTLVSRPLEKLPMGISVVSAEFMKELDVLNADTLNRIVPGLANQNNTTSEGTGNNTQYASRGFTVLPRRNGFAPGGRLYDMTGIDRVEIIRGPNSLLYGQSDAGGIINYITKRPRIRNTTELRGVTSIAVGNYAFHRASTDLELSLLPGKLGFRLPASFTSNEREFNFFRNKVIAYNPSLLFRPFKNTEISFEWEYLDVRTNFGAFQPIVWTPPGSTTEWIDRNGRGLTRAGRGGLFGPYAKAENEQSNWTLDLTSRLTDHITFRGVYSENKRDRNETVPTGGDPFRAVAGVPAPLPYYGANTRDGNRITGWKGDVLGEWTLGAFKTRTILGHEYNKNIFFASVWRGWNAATSARDNLFTLDLGFNPATGRVSRAPVASDFARFRGISGQFLGTRLDPALWRLEVGPNRFKSEWTNTRLSEVLSAYDDRLQLLAGVARGQSTLTNTTTGAQDDRRATVFQAGIGYALDARKQHMLFANRSTSYQPQFLFDINFNPLPPLTAKGLEGGLKSTWGASGLSTTIVFYTQERTDVGRQFTDFSLNPPRTYGVITPGEKVNGVEFEAWYRVTPRLNVTLLFAGFDGEITGSAANQRYLIGRELPRAPERSGNLIVNYRFDEKGPLQGLRTTLGANYRNDTWLDLGLGQNSLVRRSSPGSVFFAVVQKDFSLPGKRLVTARLNVGNLLNRDYISEGFTFGEKRTFRLSLDYKH